MFYPIITTLDGGGTGGMAGINKNVTHTGSVLSNHNNFGRGRGGRAGINKNVTHAGSQMTWEGGRAGIKNGHYTAHRAVVRSVSSY